MKTPSFSPRLTLDSPRLRIVALLGALAFALPVSCDSGHSHPADDVEGTQGSDQNGQLPTPQEGDDCLGIVVEWGDEEASTCTIECQRKVLELQDSGETPFTLDEGVTCVDPHGKKKPDGFYGPVGSNDLVFDGIGLCVVKGCEDRDPDEGVIQPLPDIPPPPDVCEDGQVEVTIPINTDTVLDSSTDKTTCFEACKKYDLPCANGFDEDGNPVGKNTPLKSGASTACTCPAEELPG